MKVIRGSTLLVAEGCSLRMRTRHSYRLWTEVKATVRGLEGWTDDLSGRRDERLRAGRRRAPEASSHGWAESRWGAEARRR